MVHDLALSFRFLSLVLYFKRKMVFHCVNSLSWKRDFETSKSLVFNFLSSVGILYQFSHIHILFLFSTISGEKEPFHGIH